MRHCQSRGVKIPVLRLYGIIAETALPLLSLVMKRIVQRDSEEWENTEGATPEEILRHRIEIITSVIRNLFKVKNIISEELREIASQDEAFARWTARARSVQGVRVLGERTFVREGL